MIKLKKYISTVVAGVVLCSSASMALAQSNPYFNQGDLVLAFQNPGGAVGANQVMLVSLGSAADLYRGQTSATLNIANLGSLLTSTFGANWYDSGTLYVSAVSAWSSQATAPFNGQLDPHGDGFGTVYVSRGRNDITETGLGAQGTSGWSGLNATAIGGIASRILQVSGDLNKGTTAEVVLLSADSWLSGYNGFDLAGNQSTAYGYLTGGVQFNFGAGSLGEWEGIDVEGALDLFRIQPRNNIPGQYGFGELNGNAVFQGSIVIGQDGSIAYVPEPGSVLLLGGVGVLFALRRRFAKAKQVN